MKYVALHAGSEQNPRRVTCSGGTVKVGASVDQMDPTAQKRTLRSTTLTTTSICTMKITMLFVVLSHVFLLEIARVTAEDYILEAKKATDFSPEVEKLWQKAEEDNTFRKDENGNFERFLRLYYHYPQSIEALAFSLQLDMGMLRLT